jgi:hypothetical protein
MRALRRKSSSAQIFETGKTRHDMEHQPCQRAELCQQMGVEERSGSTMSA